MYFTVTKQVLMFMVSLQLCSKGSKYDSLNIYHDRGASREHSSIYLAFSEERYPFSDWFPS